jgi:hypothetical protein
LAEENMPEGKAVHVPPQVLKYETLKQCHPDYCGGYLNRLWALYEGGKSLLGNGQLLREICPRNRQEHEKVYEKRLAMAFYAGTAGEIVDTLVATILGDPIRVGIGEKLTLDDWYSNFVRNVSPKGAPRVELQEFVREHAKSLLVTGDSWVRVDVPPAGNYTNRADQEKAGALDAFLVTIPTGCVTDWEEADDGSLNWIMVYSTATPRGGLTGTRNTIVHRWAYYDRVSWATYECAQKVGEPIQDNQDIPIVRSGSHTFGCVPVVRKQVPKGLWAMDTLESLAREHFNKRSDLAWAEKQALLPELYEFLGPEQAAGAMPIGENQGNARRATSQPRGQGYVQERGAGDKAQFVGPDVAPFAEARKSCSEIRDEMHRVMHLMALSQATSASALGRSADSKKADQQATNIVAGELGKQLREHMTAIFEMVSIARGDVANKDKWKAAGAAQFSATSVGDVVAVAESVETITIKSPTFHRIHQAATAEAILGERATPEALKAIADELAKNITDEDMAPVETKEKVDLGGKDKKAEADEEDEEDGESEAD